MNVKTNLALTARRGLSAALEDLEGAVARALTDPRGAADGDAAAARIGALEAALARAERERDVARAALGALRAARLEEARLVEDALRDLREVV
jgi:hypothetical protein